jgi:hypothetical protein
MKIITIIIRTVLDFISTSVSFFFIFKEPASTGEFKAFRWFNGFNLFIPTGKSVEFLCGLSFVTGKFTTLSNLVIFL